MPIDPRIQAALDAPLQAKRKLTFRTKPGYVAAPGTGPIGETCYTCRNCTPLGCDHREWVCGPAGDNTLIIDRSTKACSRWERSTRAR
jgi:hypothetical protein